MPKRCAHVFPRGRACARFIRNSHDRCYLHDGPEQRLRSDLAKEACQAPLSPTEELAEQALFALLDERAGRIPASDADYLLAVARDSNRALYRRPRRRRLGLL